MSDVLFSLHERLDQLSTPHRKSMNQRFFKMGAGHYAAEEQFIGITVPQLRQVAQHYAALSFTDLTNLLNTPVNEKRLLAVLILVRRYRDAQKKQQISLQEKIFQFFLNHQHRMSNWNIVDSSAPFIVGAHLWDKNRDILLSLAQAQNLWSRRIAIVASWFFIRQEDFDWTLKLAALLRNDPQDLIHKAVGWMLREVGKKNEAVLIDFLKIHGASMPRTMLRAAIEKFPEPVRAVYLKKARE